MPFLSERAREYGLPPKDTPEQVRLNIENGILRQVCAGVLDAKIFGNFGMHQNTLASAAVVLDDPEQSPRGSTSCSEVAAGCEIRTIA